MTTSSAIIVSDIHLGAATPENEAAFHDFLRTEATKVPDLVINGDLFDFWFEYRTVILRNHFLTLRLLADLVDAGTRIRLVGGNHDSWGGSFLRESVGIELVDGPVVTDIGGRRTYLAHGDGLGAGDHGYKMLRRVLRSRLASAAFRHVHPDWSAALVRGVSRTDSRHTAETPEGSRAVHLARHAAEVLEADPTIELVALGHCHVPHLEEMAPGRYYLNSGDWTHNCTWATVNTESVRLHRWTEDQKPDNGTL